MVYGWSAAPADPAILFRGALLHGIAFSGPRMMYESPARRSKSAILTCCLRPKNDPANVKVVKSESAKLIQESKSDIEFKPRVQDYVAASLFGVMAVMLPIIVSTQLFSSETASAESLSVSFVTRRHFPWYLFRMALGTFFGSYVIKELRQEASLVDVQTAAYPDSKFVSAGGIMVHYLEENPSPRHPHENTAQNKHEHDYTTSSQPPPSDHEQASSSDNNSNNNNNQKVLVMLHGFGGSAAAFRAVMRPLAHRLGARVIAVDMPGFGLTERPRRTADFDAEKMLENFIAALGLADGGRKVVAVGHSLGSIVAANYAVRPGSAAAAVVLVAPAIQVAEGPSGSSESSPRHSESASPVSGQSPAVTYAAGTGFRVNLNGASEQGELPRRGGAGPEEASAAGEAVAATGSGSKFKFKLPAGDSDLVGTGSRVARALALYGLQAALGAVTPAAAAALRHAVYSRDFWVRGLRSAYFDPARVTEEALADYRRPSRVRGWDTGLIRFIRYRATEGRGLPELLARAVAGAGPDPGPGQEREPAAGTVVHRLARSGLPVLVVHGREDRLVPVRAGRAVSRVLGPGAGYVEVPRCGHCPMEETPEAFVEAVGEFVEKLEAV